MRRTTRSALIVLFLGLVRPSLTAACTEPAEPQPIECAVSVALSVAVDRAALYPLDRARLDSFERRLLAEAIQKLGENRIAIDPEGHDLHFEILQTSDGEVLIAVSSRGSESADLILDAEEVEGQPKVATENISAGAWKTPNLLARVAVDLFARAIAANWNTACDPSRILSANGRYAFELPPSHPEARERYLSSLVEDGWLDPLDPRPAASLFSLSADGEEERLSTFRLDEATTPEQFLVSDDGGYVVGFDLRLPQPPRPGAREGNTLIYRADGSVVRRLPLGDVLTSGDIEEILRTTSSSDGSLNLLRAALDNDRNRLILTLDRSGKTHEIAIDLKTGTLLTPRRDLLPHMRLTISSGLPTGILGPVWNPPVCVGPTDAIEPELAFASELVREPPPSFYDHSIERPLPTYTEIAKRARLRGTVEVEVIVSETGSVSCARVTRLPMRLDTSAEAAALRWKFQPFVVDGKPVRTIGRFSFRFGGVKQSGER